MTTILLQRRLMAAVTALLSGALAAGTLGDSAALAQGAPDWRSLKTKIISGEVDITKPDVVSATVLPQLALPANRGSIGSVRQDMSSAFNRGTMDERGRTALVDGLSKMILDGNADPAVRVNAALMLGEIAGSDRKPWPAAADPLATFFGDEQLPPAIRIAAAIGLARHLETGGAALATAVGPVLVKTAEAAPSTVDPVAGEWLVGRALRMLTALGPAAPPATIVAATAILGDADRPIDSRVWAAAALGASAAAGRQIDVNAGLRSIRDLAVSVVSEEKERAERQQQAAGAATGMAAGGFPGSEAGYAEPGMNPGMAFPGFPGAASGMPQGFPGAGPGGFPGAASGYPGEGMSGDPSMGMGMGTSPIDASLTLPFRRAAWRLATLADAIDGDKGKTGLVVLAGAGTQQVRDMAKTLREAAEAIDANPTTRTILATFTKLGGKQTEPAPAEAAAPGSGAAAAGGAPAAASAPAVQPAPAPAAPPAPDNPFAQPAAQ